MNNSKIAFDNIEDSSADRQSILLEQQGEFIQIVEAIKVIEGSVEWQKLKRLILDSVVTNLERQLFNEVSKQEINTPEIYRLQGQLVWARKFADLYKLAEVFKQQIENIKIQLKKE